MNQIKQSNYLILLFHWCIIVKNKKGINHRYQKIFVFSDCILFHLKTRLRNRKVTKRYICWAIPATEVMLVRCSILQIGSLLIKIFKIDWNLKHLIIFELFILGLIFVLLFNTETNLESENVWWWYPTKNFDQL